VFSNSPAVSGCANQGVPTNLKSITVGFSEAMDPTTVTASTFTVVATSGTGPLGPVTATSLSYNAANNTAIFAVPGAGLAATTTFTVTITTGVTSATPASIPLASNFVWTFTTGADPATSTPSVISTNPANLAPAVPTNQNIFAVFSAAMDPTTITGTTFTVTGPGVTPVTGTVTYSGVGATAKFTPASPLSAGVVYTATITTGAMDLAGNAFVTPFTWTFTAGLGPDVTVPTVTTMVPASGALAVPPNQAVSATFSKAMDPSTLNTATFTLTSPGPTSVAGKVTYITSQNASLVPTFIGTFTPTSALTNGVLYTVTLTTGVEDLEGNALANTSWTFTAGPTPNLSPINFGAATGFEVFARAAISNTGTNLINGDVGLTPNDATSITGLPASDVNGTIYVALDPPVTAALTSLEASFTAASPGTLPGAAIIAENLGTPPLTLTPGLYTSAATTFEVTGGNVTLDGQGDAGGVWVFQMPSVGTGLTLTNPTCKVILVNGAQASNVYWWTNGSVTVGGSCAMVGNIVAGTSISFASTGATMNGKVYAGTGGPVPLTGAVSIAGTLGGAVGTPGACNQ